MSDTPWTLGPWYRRDNGAIWSKHPDAHPAWVVPDAPPRNADARLIAAAPEMAELLADVVEALVKDGIAAAPGRLPSDPRVARAAEVYMKAQDVLDRIRGETP